MSDEKLTKPREVALSYYITKYLSKEILVSFLMGTAIFVLILLMFQIVRLSEFAVVHQVGMKDVGKLCFYLMLSFLPMAIPIAFLFAVMVGVSRANSEGELIALQVSGFSVRQLYFPLFLFSTVVTAICLYTSLYVVPRGIRNFDLLMERVGNEHVISALKPGVFLEGFYGMVIFAEHLIPIKGEMKGVFLYDERDEAHPMAITARAGILKVALAQSLLTLRLTDGSIYPDQRRPGGVQQKIDFNVYDVNLHISERSDYWRDFTVPSMDLAQLRERMRQTQHDPTSRQLQVELHRRIVLSFSCIIFSALGFFIGALTARGIRSAAIIICLLVAVAYWIGYIAANALAVNGGVWPWVWLWTPNFVFSVIAYLSYRRYRASN